MSIYSERLAKLKKEIIEISKAKKKKRFKNNQFIMINFINAVTNKAEFIIDNIKITLYIGDSKKGFQHILEQHYCKGCKGEITTMDILNMTDIIEKGIKLSKVGVSNSNLIVYKKIKGIEEHKIVLKPTNDGSFVVTMYKIG